MVAVLDLGVKGLGMGVTGEMVMGEMVKGGMVKGEVVRGLEGEEVALEMVEELLGRGKRERECS